MTHPIRTRFGHGHRAVSRIRARPAGSATQGPVAGLVLAGGRGRRMGGLDKGLVRRHGVPLAAQAMAVLAPWCDVRVISANRNRARYRHLADVVVADRDSGFPGPLAGLAAGLEAVHAPLWLVCPCDVPDLALDVPVRLLRALRLSGGADVAVLRDAQRLQPLVLAVRGHLAPTINHYLDAGGRSVLGWLEGRRITVVQVQAVVGNRNAFPPV